MTTTSKAKPTSKRLLSNMALRWACLFPILAAFTAAQASTVGWYRMEGTAGDAISSVATSEGTAPTLTQSGATFNYGSNVAGSQIYDPVSDTTYANTSSLEYTGNATTAYLQSADTVGGPFDVADFTIEMFVKVDTVVNNYRYFVDHDPTNAWGFRVLDNDDNYKVGAVVDNGTLSGSGDAVDVADGLWHHMAIVVKSSDDGNNFSRFYFDYQLIRENTGLTYLNDYNPEVSAPFRIYAEEFSGYADEVRFSNSILSTDDFLVAIPEPGTFTLFGLGFIAIYLGIRRRSKK
ncbi:PEP-CTERM sorting domain-containing protein [Kiritimatiellota bacterium B12222]|nr:PEP-CTERM sorting domain-containing protein [Kiritimatiellota bacterium B12222]